MLFTVGPGWRCAVRLREAGRRYAASEAGRAKRKAYWEANKERHNADARERYAADPEKKLAKSRARYEEKAVEIAASQRDYYYNRGGWATARKRALTRQRANVTERLAQLQEEEQSLVAKSGHTESSETEGHTSGRVRVEAEA